MLGLLLRGRPRGRPAVLASSRRSPRPWEPPPVPRCPGRQGFALRATSPSAVDAPWLLLDPLESLPRLAGESSGCWNGSIVLSLMASKFCDLKCIYSPNLRLSLFSSFVQFLHLFT